MFFNTPLALLLFMIVDSTSAVTCSGGSKTLQQAQSYSPAGDLVCTNCVRSYNGGHQNGVARACRACGGATCTQSSDCGGMCEHWGHVCGSGYNCQCLNGFCAYTSGVCPPGWVSNGGSSMTLRCCPPENTEVGFAGGLNSDGSCKCLSGYFWKDDAHACILCPSGSTSTIVGAISCTCSTAGHSWDMSSGTCYLAPTPTPTTTPSQSSTPTPSVSPTVSRINPCNEGYVLANRGCTPCPPGTYSKLSSLVCQLCPAGTFGNRAALTTEACSGACPTCLAGSISSDSPSLTCISADIRAVPSSFGLQLWPAAHPQNTQHVDLIIAPLLQCQQMMSNADCINAEKIQGIDGLTRYVIGTAQALNMEAAETLTCA